MRTNNEFVYALSLDSMRDRVLLCILRVEYYAIQEQQDSIILLFFYSIDVRGCG